MLVLFDSCFEGELRCNFCKTVVHAIASSLYLSHNFAVGLLRSLMHRFRTFVLFTAFGKYCQVLLFL